MSAKTPDPLRLDVARFAGDEGLLQGQWPLAELPRLAEGQVPPGDAETPVVRWRARGELRTVRGGSPQVWLHLELDTTAWLTCQRCLQPMAVSLAVAPAIRFAANESQAASEDADSDEDVLALTRSLNLRELAEDELLLALPLVPRHASCPQPLPLAAGDEAAAQPPADPAGSEGPEVKPHPFAALAALKRGSGS